MLAYSNLNPWVYVRVFDIRFPKGSLIMRIELITSINNHPDQCP
jgi:hypothetical protein